MAKSKGTPAVDAESVRMLADLLNEKDLSEIEYSSEDWHIRVVKNESIISASTPVTTASKLTHASTLPAVSAPSAIVDHPGIVTSPMVGTVYVSDEPDAPAFVNVGDTISEGETLVLIEAMKVFNPIKAPKTGKIAQILISNGDPVEFGEPLMIIE